MTTKIDFNHNYFIYQAITATNIKHFSLNAIVSKKKYHVNQV